MTETTDPHQITADMWREDLEMMADGMRRHHRNLFHTVSPCKFDGAVRDLWAKIPSLAGHEIIVALARTVALIGDGHTAIYLKHYDPAIQFRDYPLRLYRFSDGVFIRRSGPEHRAMVGGRVLAVGGVPIDHALDRVAQVVSKDNTMRAWEWAPALLVVPEILHALGIVSDMNDATFLVEIDNERTTIRPRPVNDVSCVEWSDARSATERPEPLYLREPDRHFWFEYLGESRTVYVKYNAVADMPDETVAAFFSRVFRVVDERDVDRLVVDIRDNVGGDNTLNWPLIHGIVSRLEVNRRGKLFTIIGRATFSAAMNCANALQQHTHSTFVGEPTGASPNHFGDATQVVLTHSKISVHVSTLWWQDAHPADARPYLSPDVWVELSSSDYCHNLDPVLEAILTRPISMRPDP